jgi:hypothetical protein
MEIQTYYFASKLARTHVQELQHEAWVAKLARRHLASESGTLLGRLTTALHFKAAPRSATECCPA